MEGDRSELTFRVRTVRKIKPGEVWHLIAHKHSHMQVLYTYLSPSQQDAKEEAVLRCWKIGKGNLLDTQDDQQSSHTCSGNWRPRFQYPQNENMDRVLISNAWKHKHKGNCMQMPWHAHTHTHTHTHLQTKSRWRGYPVSQSGKPTIQSEVVQCCRCAQ